MSEQLTDEDLQALCDALIAGLEAIESALVRHMTPFGKLVMHANETGPLMRSIRAAIAAAKP